MSSCMSQIMRSADQIKCFYFKFGSPQFATPIRNSNCDIKFKKSIAIYTFFLSSKRNNLDPNNR